MTKRYDEIMDKVEVTNEMRNRILHNIQNTDIVSASNSKKVYFHRSNMKKYLSIAACFVLLLAGSLTVTSIIRQDSNNEPEILAPGNDIVTVDSMDELSGMIGFQIEELSNLPFDVEQTEYISYWNEVAEVSYMGENQMLVFRKSVGAEDNSGDYTEYKNNIDTEINKVNVQIKGNDNLFYLANWQQGGYSYSVRLENGISQENFMDILNNILK